MSMKHENAAVAAIQFALDDEDGIDFLRYWNHGEFDVLRRNWPEAPEAVYIGADPLHPETAVVVAGDTDTVLLDFTETERVMIDGASRTEDSGDGWYVNGETYPEGMTLRQCLADAMRKRGAEAA